jgi:nucleoside-diphosphate-sugar epimerase
MLNVSYPRVILPRAAMGFVCAAVERAFGVIGRKAPIHRRSMDFFTKSVEFDVSKAERMLDFHAEVPLRSGMQRTVTWYREQGLL